jgi:ribosomal protein L40E
VYIYLPGEDIDGAQCILSEMTKVKKEDERLKPLVCERCQADNPPGSKFYSKCGAPSDLKIAVRLDQARAKLDMLLDKLTEDPQKLDKLLNLLEVT